MDVDVEFVPFDDEVFHVYVRGRKYIVRRRDGRINAVEMCYLFDKRLYSWIGSSASQILNHVSWGGENSHGLEVEQFLGAPIITSLAVWLGPNAELDVFCILEKFRQKTEIAEINRQLAVILNRLTDLELKHVLKEEEKDDLDDTVLVDHEGIF